MGLVGGINLGQFAQSGFAAQSGHSTSELFGPDPRGLQLGDQLLQDPNEPGPVGQWGVVGQGQVIHHRPDQPVLDGLAQFSVYLAGGAQALGVQSVEGQHPHANGAPGLRQAAAPGAHLQVGGHEDARGRVQALGRIADEVQYVCCLSGCGRGEVEMNRHIEPPSQLPTR